ncbi:MAG: hypothetical protein HY052_07595 [Proteobacteria bacterium]|nr:hypothetical protein [Pseudomonadota bacterium]
MSIVLHIKDYSTIKTKVTDEPLGHLIALTNHQESVEKLLMCQHCKEVWVDILPTTMPVRLIECECCGRTGHVIDSVPRRLR